MKRLILTAINDSDEIWYSCFIPFILSLRKTNYQDDIGVITYHLSPEKKEKLQENNILIFEGGKYLPDLSIDRSLTAASIAEEYHYDQIALYDADIWFPKTDLTLFDKLQNEQALYACYDVIYPPFLTKCLPENEKDKAQIRFDILYQKQGGIWQVGLLVGTRNAWINYRNYIQQNLRNVDGFSMVYGVDTTVFNFYAMDTGNVCHLSEKYNCLPLWGMRVKQVPNELLNFTFEGEGVEGIHITNYHRSSHEYNFLHLRKHIYLSEGKAFSLVRKPKLFSNCGASFSALPQKAEKSVMAEKLETVSVIARVDKDGTIYEKGDLILDLEQNSKLMLRNHQSESITFKFCYHKIFNRKLPMAHYVYLNGQSKYVGENDFYTMTLSPDETVIFVSEDIRHDVAVRYIFRDVKFI